MAKSATVLLSGGIDSACCLKMLLDDGYTAYPVFVDFGQPANQIERISSAAVASLFGLSVANVEVRGQVSFAAGEIRGRNPFLLTTALMHTPAVGGILVLGIHAGVPYYDCGAPFLHRINDLVAECTDGRFGVAAPLLSWSKSDIYSYFRTSGLPPELTHSCEIGVPGGCGECASCQDRRFL